MDNNQNKYLEKFYKRSISIDEIKNTYPDNKGNIDDSSVIKNSTQVYYLAYFEKIFLWLFFTGIIYRLNEYLL